MMKRFLKDAAKKLFDAWGVEVRRKGALRTNMSEVLAHVSSLGLSPRTVVDVGVAYGTLELYEAFSSATHLLIEPLAEFEPALKEICGKFRAEYVLAAANDVSGTVVINVHEFPVASSIFKEAEGPHADGVPREVRAVTVDDAREQRGLPGPYVLKVDVQGAELRALDGARRVLDDAELVILEVHLFRFFSDGPELHDVVHYMKGHGFCAYDIFGQSYRPLDGALASVDVAFVKEAGRFRETHSWSTAATARTDHARVALA